MMGGANLEALSRDAVVGPTTSSRWRLLLALFLLALATLFFMEEVVRSTDDVPGTLPDGNARLEAREMSRASDSGQLQPGPTVMRGEIRFQDVFGQSDSEARVTHVLLPIHGTERALQAAVAVAVAVGVGSFELRTDAAAPATATMQQALSTALALGKESITFFVNRVAESPVHPESEAPSSPRLNGHGPPGPPCPTTRPLDLGVESATPASTDGSRPRLARVVLATVATGRYRQLGIKALESALLHFGGDCIPSFHLLTDNVSGVPLVLNPVMSPYREWPESGLSKFDDIRTGLRAEIETADYFYFLDADVLFEEDVLLNDVAGDLVGVEHPMYPRDHEGWCNRKDGQAMCAYPYDRNPRSHAFIPEEVGKFYHTTVGGQGRRHTYLTTNWWYLQSAFWGGRAIYMLEMLDELAGRVDADRKAGIYSMVVQDERYFNYYMHREAKNKSKQYRILSHAFLYPFRDEGFGDWVTKSNRPIIFHGTKVPGKLIKGEVQIQSNASTECLGFFLDPQVGMFGCHGGGGMQGWLPETADGGLAGNPLPSNQPIRFRQATTMKSYSKCINGDVVAGQPARLSACKHGGDAVLWRYSDVNKQLVNAKSGLCLDALKKPPHKRDPVLVNGCNSMANFQKWRFSEIGVGTECTQKWCHMGM